MLKDIFSIDNLLHSLVSVAFVIVVAIFLGALAGFVAAILAMVGLYLREASQVDWDFTLKGSFHKHMEWIVGSVAGFLAAIIFAVIA